eukprot:1783105-Amphidinium_carterae.1
MFGKLGKSWEDGDAWWDAQFSPFASCLEREGTWGGFPSLVRWEQMQQMFMMMKGKKGKLMEGKGSMDGKGMDKSFDGKGASTLNAPQSCNNAHHCCHAVYAIST